MKTHTLSKPWYQVLLALRRIHGREEIITSGVLAREAKISIPFASAWLFKFERYGYVSKEAKYITGRRWSWSWKVTRWGLRFRPRKVRAGLRLAANPPDNEKD